MHDEAPPELSDLLDQIAFFLAQPLDFTSTDPETTETKVRILTAAAFYFNMLSVREFGGRLGAPRDHGLVEQVVAAAFQTFGGVDPHPGPFDKAAMLLRGITQGHPFNDGNKRTGFLVAAYFLELMGYPSPDTLPVDAVVAFCLAVSAGDLRDVEAIAEKLWQFWSGDSEPAP
ncbi:MAG TPA: Fic family protein [Chloroflexota bacterium]|nr:Fic family protein [Chloroflexota bacterium]